MRRWIGPRSPLRSAFDLAWLVAFGLVVVQLVRSEPAGALLSGGVRLGLTPGVERSVLRWRGRSVARVEQRVRRRGEGWIVVRSYAAAGPAAASAQRSPDEEANDGPLAELRLRLRRDLSLASIELRGDLSRMLSSAAMLGGTAPAGGGAWTTIGARVLERFGARIRIGGRCNAAGECHLRGRLGRRPFARSVTVGKGPVLAEAVQPLLARGMLGRTVELQLFDPLTLSRRTVSYEVVGWKPTTVAGKTVRALHVVQHIGGLRAELWLDRRGSTLRSTLPGGLSTERVTR